jgi:hypothetical protein
MSTLASTPAATAFRGAVGVEVVDQVELEVAAEGELPRSGAEGDGEGDACAQRLPSPANDRAMRAAVNTNLGIVRR